MRIEAPDIVADSESVTLQACVRLENRADRFPERLWFRYPREWESLLSQRLEPFITSLSSVASVLREPIQVDAAISERLHAGLEEYWTIFHRWFPERFFPVEVQPEGYAADPVPAAACGTAFSGGVDSFFSLFRHHGTRELRPTYRVRYALFVHGFDIPLADHRTYGVTSAAYEEALASCGVQLIRVATNVRQFVKVANWEMSHGSALSGVAMTLAQAMRRFYVPSSKSYTTIEPWGSDPLIDGLLSTDQFEVIHDGAAYTRFDKLEQMQDWAPFRRLLRTCWEHPDGLRNCGHCTNCRRTMMVLASLGVLDSFETFPRVVSARHFASGHWETPHERLFGAQSIAYAQEHGRTAVAWAGRIAMRRSHARALLRRLLGLRPEN